MVLSADFHVWLLNTSEEPMDVPPGELFGFGTGAYVNQVVERPLV